MLLVMFSVNVFSEGRQSPVREADQGEIIELIAGSYTRGKSQGIYRLAYNTRTQSFTKPSLLSQLSNPSYGTLSRDLTTLYFVEEGSEGRVQSFNRSTLSLEFAPLNSVSSRGEDPCYLSLSPNEQHLAVANYSSGNIAVFKLTESGALGESPTVLQHSGRGVHPERQLGPHAHWAQWDPLGRFLYAVDLGTDKVMAYPFDPSDGLIGKGFTALTTDPGAGPRHMVFHPAHDWVYLLNELSNQIIFAKKQPDGQLEKMQQISTLPEGFAGANQGAHLAINSDGSRLYSSNRGDDSIAVFEIAEDGRLQILQHISTEGHWPRFFLLLSKERLLFVANEHSNNIFAFEIDAEGHLSQVGQPVEIDQPTFLTTVSSIP